MATRSRIAMEMEDKTVVSIYCHWDGYPSHNGQTLIDHYNTPEKVKALIALGSLSSLQERLEPSGPHSFSNPEEGVTVAYHRDRGEDFSQQTHKPGLGFFKGDIEEFGYLFTQEGEWLVAAAYGSSKMPMRVIDALKE